LWNRGYSRAEAARSLDINANMLRLDKKHQRGDGQAFCGNGKLSPEQEEIRHLRKKTIEV